MPVATTAADEDEIFVSKQLDAVKVSLGQGLEIAERDSKGKAVKAEFDIEHGRPVWEVNTLSEAGLLEYEIDAESGRIAKIEDERIRGRLYSFVMGVRLKDIEAAKASAIEQSLQLNDKQAQKPSLSKSSASIGVLAASNISWSCVPVTRAIGFAWMPRPVK